MAFSLIGTLIARELLPRDFFGLPAADDDEAIISRGPNILLRDRARRLARRQDLLGQPVGRGRPNRPADVAAVETLLRQTGDLSFRPEHQPTGYFQRRPGRGDPPLPASQQPRDRWHRQPRRRDPSDFS